MRILDAVRLGCVCLVFAVLAGHLEAQTVRLFGPLTLADTTRQDVDTPLPCSILPIRDTCMAQAGITDRNKFINNFYRTYNSISFLNQIKSIYNGSSASATVSADLTTLNFTSGIQVNVATNIQAGSSGPTSVGSGVVPTLSGNAAGQATQNMLYGGTLVASVLYPLVAVGAANVNNPGSFGLSLDIAAREGIDIQNFKAGTSTTVTSPPSHSSAQIEGYISYNSTNLTADSSTFAGALFLGGSYGYSHTSHDYARDYGFGNNVNNAIGQISAGILINNVAKISVSRGFGPSQTYIDSTSMLPRTINNFKSWSIGITYQSPPPKKTSE
jgi:hypothetical protein